MQKKKILVSLSGGVDSAISAFLLKKKGFYVEAAYFITWKFNHNRNIFLECSTKENLKVAKSVAQYLNIPLRILNFISIYKKKIVQKMLYDYMTGSTPNSDMICNRFIKFGYLINIAKKLGFEGIATGHYVKIINIDKKYYYIHKASDRCKDQSYFLSFIKKEIIAFLYFPIGNFSKQEVRFLAKKFFLPNYLKKDSQGICFLGKIKIKHFLNYYLKYLKGLIINEKTYQIIGNHNGLYYYTLGQRKGLQLSANNNFQYYIVIEKYSRLNILYIGIKSLNYYKILYRKIFINTINFLINEQNIKYEKNYFLSGKSRYRDPLRKIYFIKNKKKEIYIIYNSPQFSLVKGQFLSFYKGSQLIGGGLYEKILY